MRFVSTSKHGTRTVGARTVGALAIAFALLVPRPASADSIADLKRSARALPGASGAFVYDVTAGKTLLNRKGGARRILASNTKLFTAAAALDRYGSGERFLTTLWTDGGIADGELQGNLYLRGGGDPLFGSTDYVRKRFGSGATVEQLALNAKLVGLTHVTGRVYGDESIFDDRRGTATYGFRRSGEIGGQLGALIFNRGVSGQAFQRDPPRFAAQRMRVALENVGVTVDGSTGVRPTPPDARLVAFVESPEISRIVRLMNKPSDNYLAEMLAKGLAMPDGALNGGSGARTGSAAGGQALGYGDGASPAGTAPAGGAAPGDTIAPTDPQLVSGAAATTRAGVVAARRFAATLGSRVWLGDGSGLSRRDRAAPREVVDLLSGFSGHAEFEALRESLPVPGVDGTLDKRMRGTEASRRCSAKTGTLSNVSTLSGYCTLANGHIVAFSILNNRVWPTTARAAQDRIVKVIARLR